MFPLASTSNFKGQPSLNVEDRLLIIERLVDNWGHALLKKMDDARPSVTLSVRPSMAKSMNFDRQSIQASKRKPLPKLPGKYVKRYTQALESIQRKGSNPTIPTGPQDDTRSTEVPFVNVNSTGSVASTAKDDPRSTELLCERDFSIGAVASNAKVRKVCKGGRENISDSIVSATQVCTGDSIVSATQVCTSGRANISDSIVSAAQASSLISGTSNQDSGSTHLPHAKATPSRATGSSWSKVKRRGAFSTMFTGGEVGAGPPPGRSLLENAVLMKHQQIKISETSRTVCGEILQHPAFDLVVASVIAISIVIIALEIQMTSTGRSAPLLFFGFEVFFVLFFSMELTIRLIVWQKRYFELSGVGWGVLDMVLVISGLVDLLYNIASGGPGQQETGSLASRILRVLRMSRLARILRMARFLNKFRVMISMISNSFGTMLMMMCLLFAQIFLFSIIFTDGYAAHVEYHRQGHHLDTDMVDYFGSLPTTMFTLFRSITSGMNWTDPCETLYRAVGLQYYLAFIAYIIFTVFFVLNLITGIMVDGAVELIKYDKNIMVERENRAREAAAGHLIELLASMDLDQNGVIDKVEFFDSLEQKEIRVLMEALDVDTSTAISIFECCDVDNNGVVDIEEWVEGMRKMQGNCKSSDFQIFKKEVRCELGLLSQKLDVLLYNMLFADGKENEIISASAWV